MKSSKFYILFIGILLPLLCSPVHSMGQNGGSAGAFSRLGFGPRGMATGNAMVSVSSNGIFGYYNPALAALTTKLQVDLSTSAMSFDRTLNTASGVFRLPPTGGLAVSIINANVSNIDGRTSSGYHTDMLSTHEYQISAMMGQQLSSSLSAGIGLKYYLSDLHSELPNATTLGIDIGILYHFSDQLQLGATIRDLLASYNWNSGTLYGDDSSAQINTFPLQIQFGGSYQFSQKLSASIQGGQRIYEDKSVNNIQLGGWYNIHERFTLRSGWQVQDLSSIGTTNQFSAGFSIHLPFDLLSPSIDYAFVQEPNNISYMHTFGIQFQP